VTIDPDAAAFADAYAADPTDDDTLDHYAARMAAGAEDGMDDLLESLAERSHIGWMREKQAQGFADHALVQEDIYSEVYPNMKVHVRCACCDLPAGKHHADMLPYADLSESVKEYDRATVRGVLDGIREAGYRVVKVEQLSRLQEAVALLNSMVICSEEHSATSRAVVRAALNAS
jgi:hypothetical protein